MLNKLKNVIYGSPNASFDTEFYNEQHDGPRDEHRQKITRSLSFREDLRSEFIARRIKDATSYKLSTTNETPEGGNTTNKYSSWSNKVYSPDQRLVFGNVKVPKFSYSRPEFLQLKTEDEILVSADHQIRPIILPRDVTRLPWKSGYAECINAGKSMRNEDQAACYEGAIPLKSRLFDQQHEPLSKSITSIEQNHNLNMLPWVYFGVFDGHAGHAVAIAAAIQLHHIISDKLNQLSDLLIALEFDHDTINRSKSNNNNNNEDAIEEFSDCHDVEDRTVFKHENGTKEDDDDEPNTDSSDKITIGNEASADSTVTTPTKDATTSEDSEEQESSEQNRETSSNDKTRRQTSLRRGSLPSMVDICSSNITVSKLITGVLETAFCEMDSLIAQDKCEYKMPGGCTAVVSLFILGKLYVCNAGDSRAIVYKKKEVIPMSFDFTPISERERIVRLGQHRPEFLGEEFTQLQFIRRPTRGDLGKQMLYRDAYMTGWSMKTITYEDLKFPLVWGEGKRSRLLATMGVTRGFGDHELRSQFGSVPIKPFLTPEPEVKILALDEDELTPEDVLIMGSDGLWDVTSNEEAAEIVINSFELFPDSERSKYRYMTAAQDLVIHSRGHTTYLNKVWRIKDERFASLDDIAVFVIPLKQYRDEYLEWMEQRSLVKRITKSVDKQSSPER